MKILISSCVYGNDVRWNGSNRRYEEIHTWAEENGFDLVPVCPEHELFGTPRKSIRLRQKDDEVLAIMGNQEVYRELQDKCQEIAERHEGVVAFIGFSNSPSCGLSTGVKGRGSTIKAPMHQSLDCPTTEASSMNTEANRNRFLERIRKRVRNEKDIQQVG
jgi:uncharacterized protein YbbK (DUF523 family)